ncbi:hypothetical protein A3A70_01080 [candidate division WWE3 bacterium RIFCSPLOWO2_01_FULL_42_11]|uniref:Uncharacterized protein n=1 Tax=candidate division WWE3 bacterium RIFCSPLOWO2_01_FULL_42_11 TaxID=1802627 RepID=A0A1F4VRB4_UNCKA|nr:MAG: hypothetical protein A3A70_01080 [candidate division WWE3 bacterium RIFCSPLOWO2_01_FULL_42_11]
MAASFLFGNTLFLSYSFSIHTQGSHEMGWRKLPDCLFSLALGAVLAWFSIPAIASMAVETNPDKGAYLPIAGIIWFVTFALVYGELKPVAQFIVKDWFLLWQIQDLGRDLKVNSLNLESPERVALLKLGAAVEELCQLGPQFRGLRHLYRTVLPLLQNVAKARWELNQTQNSQLEEARQQFYSDLILAEEGVEGLRRTIILRREGNDPNIST